MKPSDRSSCQATHDPIVRSAARMLVLGGLALLGSCADPSSSQSNVSDNRVIPLFQGASQSCSGSNGAMSCSLTLTSRITPEKSAELKTDEDLRRHCSTIFDNYRQVTQAKTCSAGSNILSGAPDIDSITSVTCSFPVQSGGASDSAPARTASITVAGSNKSLSDDVSKLCSDNGVACVVESDPCKGDGLVLKINDTNENSDHRLGELGIAKICHAYSKPTKGNFTFEATLTSSAYPNGITVCKGVFGSFQAGEAAEAPQPEPRPEPAPGGKPGEPQPAPQPAAPERGDSAT